MYKFTIFIPAYNRSHTLGRLLKSLESQYFKDFECVIIDDGSTDNTREFVKVVKNSFSFPITYVYQENQGKHIARNKAIKLAKGSLFLTIDSDDTIYPNTLKRMNELWGNIPEAERNEYAGVEGLCVRMGDKKQLGNKFPADKISSNHLETRFRMNITGDKMRFIRTNVFKEHLFPVIKGEKFITESTVWNRIGLSYKTLYVNENFAEVEYQSNGLTNNSLKIRMKSPKGCRMYYKNFLTYISPDFQPKIKYKIRNCINYFRFSFHANIPVNTQIKENPLFFIYNSLLIFGLISYNLDKWNTRSR